eukprot:CAMPEP_0117420134 /NCGR_PEP_ID=MMETSP0758-20121206/1533_1 /TAXON_ID=63605 /ORGANISM="Percolomonas cosmopolitus, Strain AE-1 (ATCC 50343)" /LENGTH=326 /DNA_ID=CAMNT_0005201569 /DNA_START=55 /DNA_END=1032 /DNA_ORIENTATION=+
MRKKLEKNETIVIPNSIKKLHVVFTFLDKPYSLAQYYEDDQEDPEDDIYFPGQMISKKSLDTKSVTKYRSVHLNFETEMKLGTNFGVKLFGLNRSNNKINKDKLNRLGPAILGKERSEIPNMVDQIKLEKALKNHNISVDDDADRVNYLGKSYPKQLFNKYIVINKTAKDSAEKLTKSEKHLYASVPGVDIGVQYLPSNHSQSLEDIPLPPYLRQKYPHYELIELDFDKIKTNHVKQMNMIVKLPLINKQMSDSVTFINARRQGAAKTTITTKKIAVSTEFMIRIYDMSDEESDFHPEIAQYVTELDLSCFSPQQLGVMYKMDDKW